MEKLEITHISAGSVFKLVSIGLLFGVLPLCIIFGVMGTFGMDTVKWNGEPVTGISALVVGPLIGVFLALVFTAIMGSVIALGLWIFSKVRPIAIYFIPLESKG